MRKMLRRGFLILVVTIICAAGVEKRMQRIEDEGVLSVVKIVIPEEIENEIHLLAIERRRRSSFPQPLTIGRRGAPP